MDHRELLMFSVVSLFLLSDLSISSAQNSGRLTNVLELKTGSSPSSTGRHEVDPSQVEQLSWRPRIFIYRGFLSNEECDHIISIALGDEYFWKNTVVGADGIKRYSEVRTSSGTFLPRGQDEIITGIEERIATWTFLPPENGELLQVLRYEIGEKYDEHHDYFADLSQLKYGGHRIATILMYLSDVVEGGETVFPLSEKKNNQSKGDNWSDCAKKGFAVKPRKGDALLFFNLHLNASVNPLSEHGSCPVIKGVKWSATKWIRVRAYHPTGENLDDDDNGCVDEDDRCAQWASLGECKKNPAYMVGTDALPGHCKKSCDAC